jgi:hypothetical protein
MFIVPDDDWIDETCCCNISSVLTDISEWRFHKTDILDYIGAVKHEPLTLKY